MKKLNYDKIIISENTMMKAIELYCFNNDTLIDIILVQPTDDTKLDLNPIERAINLKKNYEMPNEIKISEFSKINPHLDNVNKVEEVHFYFEDDRNTIIFFEWHEAVNAMVSAKEIDMYREVKYSVESVGYYTDLKRFYMTFSDMEFSVSLPDECIIPIIVKMNNGNLTDITFFFDRRIKATFGKLCHLTNKERERLFEHGVKMRMTLDHNAEKYISILDEHDNVLLSENITNIEMEVSDYEAQCNL